MTDCHLWMAHTGTSGHGRIGIMGKVKFAHRISYEIYVGPIPEGLSVLHNCDVPYCVNPNHLRLGTHAENMKDCAIRGRALTTPAQVRKIKNDLADGVRQCDIAREHGLSLKYVYRIKKNQLRKYL